MSDIWPDNKTSAQFMQEITTCWQMIEQLKEDNERLRDELSTFRQGKHHTENAEVKAEIKQLRSELDACGACMKRADAEIKRLRWLLREVWDAAPCLGADINTRVREALGK